MKERNENIDNNLSPEKARQRAGIKAYSIWFGIGSLVGTAVSIWGGLMGLSTVFVFASLFGAIGYQIKMKNYEK